MLKSRDTACVAALGIVLLARPYPAGACVCYETEGLEADFREATAVFAGKVVALKIATLKIEGHVQEQMVATLRVQRSWKGPKDSLLNVRTCGTQAMGCTCGTDFRLGAHFVIFAVGKPLATGSCQRTRPYTPVPGEPGMHSLGAEDLIRDLDALTAARR